MNKKILLAIIAVVLLSIAIYLLLIFNKKTPTLSQPETKTSDTGSVKFPVPSSKDTKMSIKVDNEIIEMNNVYKNPVKNLSGNGVEFIENSDYHMSFYPENQTFLITLLNPDIQKTRDKAENDLLNFLGISKDQACKLNVDLGMPRWVNEKAAGRNYGLSFCLNGIPFPKQ